MRSPEPNTGTEPRRAQSAAVRAALGDVAAVLLFVALGRRSHDEGSVLAGALGTAWPFLIGLAAGWTVALVTRTPPAGVRAGILALAGTVGVGMLVRHTLAGEGTPVSFVAVATVFLALFLLGWRLLGRRIRRRADRRPRTR